MRPSGRNKRPVIATRRIHEDVWCRNGLQKPAVLRYVDITKTMTDSTDRQIMVLGVGNLLFTDEGVGIQVVQSLSEEYSFSHNVSIEDGGVLGIRLLGIISQADDLIVVDAIRNGGPPGTLYRLDGDAIPSRIRAKNSLHQVDLLEALTLCKALDKVPETVIIGVEPQDIETIGLELTVPVQEKFEELKAMILQELDRLGGAYATKRGESSCA
jgi:hydrogenase maturation protease